MIRSALIVAATALTLIGCAPKTNGEQACDATSAQGLIGRGASATVAAEAQRLSGAATVRWLQPGQIVTMEFRATRLNLQLDEQGRIAAIRCG